MWRSPVTLPPARNRSLHHKGGALHLAVAGLAALFLLGGGAAWFLMGEEKTAAGTEKAIVQTVERKPFQHFVVAQGEVESSNSVEVRCEVKTRGQANPAIIDVVPEGSEVEEGDLLITLDSSAYDQELVQQQILCNSAEAALIQTKNTYEAAEIAKKEYLEGIFKQEEQTILSEVFLAEENLRRARQYVQYSERLAAKGYVTPLQLEGDRFAVEKAQNELDTAQTKLNVLREYTKQKQIKTLDSDIASAKAAWDSNKNSYELEIAKLAEIKEQIEACSIYAPTAGTVVYANETDRRGNDEFVVEPGATVRERQVLIRLPDPEHMQVEAKINESRVSKVQPGQPVTIRLDALSDVDLKGKVVKVNRYAEPGGWMSSGAKEYATEIAILNPPPNIRSGMNAEVEIRVDNLPTALQLPVQAVYDNGDATYCIVQDAQNNLELRRVQVYSSNNSYAALVEENSEVREGDQVVMHPRSFVDQFAVLSERPDEASDDSEEDGNDEFGDAPQDAVAANAGGEAPAGEEQGPESRGPGGPEEEGPSGMLAQLDANSDGVIDADEIESVPTEFRDRLLENDANGDGQIDAGERSAIEARMRQLMQGGGPGGGGPPERGP